MKNVQSFEGLTVVDLGLGFPDALLVKMFTGLGARVARFEPEGGDPLDDAYPFQQEWRRKAVRPSRDERDEWISRADVILTGGEDYPGIHHPDPSALHAANPRAVVLNIEGYPAAHPAAGRPAVDFLVQARSGIANEIVAGRPVHLTFAAPSFGAALQGMVGVLAALVERTRSGTGQIVTTSLQQGTLHYLPFWMLPRKPDPSFGKSIPKGTVPLLFPCADGRWLHFSTGANPALAYQVLGLEAPATPHPNWFGDADRIGAAIAEMSSDEAIALLREAGMAVELVHGPGEMWDHAQAVANGIIETHDDGRSVSHPLNFSGAEPVPGSHPAAAASPATERPLSGFRFLDFGHFVAGPYATKLLADLGADVIKVETTSGERMRENSFSAYLSVNRGKRTLAVDAKDQRGREIIRRLAGSVNGISHNFRPGVAERLGLDGATLRGVRPDLFTVHTSAYGVTGPKIADPGFDPIMQALTGLEVRAGGDGGDPLWYRLLTIDYSAGLLGAIGMLVGVLEQLEGRAVDVTFNLLDTGLFLLSELFQDAEGTFRGAGFTNAERTGYHPAESLYQTRDGWVAVAARSTAMAERLMSWAGGEAPDAPVTQWPDAAREQLRSAFAGRSTSAALRELGEVDVWAEEAVADGWEDLQAVGDPLVTTLADPHKGDILVTGATLAFSRSEVVESGSAPVLGSATRELLLELGYAEDVVEDLYATGVVTDFEQEAAEPLQGVR
ncbi:CoA transferase [Georgenia sp. AZ-5]|uniref:CoA transferase n=1 Tax=Georgenia sp. AZ-5 TaxID=3367526 RepID=UPI0037553768